MSNKIEPRTPVIEPIDDYIKHKPSMDTFPDYLKVHLGKELTNVSEDIRWFFNCNIDKLPKFAVLALDAGKGKSSFIRGLSMMMLKPGRTIPLLIVNERIDDAVVNEKLISFYVISQYLYIKARLLGYSTQQLDKIVVDRLKTIRNTLNNYSAPYGLQKIEAIIKQLCDIASYSEHPVGFTCSAQSKICLKLFTDDSLPAKCIDCDATTCSANKDKWRNRPTTQVSIITHKHFTNTDNKSSYLPYTKARAVNTNRVVLIDECPEVLKLHTLIMECPNKPTIKTTDYKFYILLEADKHLKVDPAIINLITKQLRRNFAELSKNQALSTERELYKIVLFPDDAKRYLTTLKSQYDASGEKDNYYIVDILLKLSGKEVLAIYSKTINKHTISFSYLENKWKQINFHNNSVLIFDATAKTDPHYIAKDAPKIIDLNQKNKFPKLQIILYSNRDIYKSKVEKLLSSINEKIIEYEANRKFLVVTSKDCEAKVSSKLGVNSNVKIDHYGNLKGKNDYIDCNAILFTNVWLKPENYYTLIAKDIYPKLFLTGKWERKVGTRGEIRIDRSMPLINYIDGTYKFNNPYIEETKISLIASDIIQDIYRTAIRYNNSADVKVYLPITNRGLTDKIEAAFPGCTVTSNVIV